MKTTINPDNWIRDYYDYLFNYAKKKISDESKVEDLIQDTFIAGLRSMKNFSQKSTEKTWITSILKHKIIDYYRAQQTAKGKIERNMLSNEEYFQKYFKEPACIMEEETKFDYVAENNLFSARLSRSLDKLPKKQAKVFEMKVMKEYDTDAISEILNISRNNVWVLVSRAKKNLASEFAEYRNAI
ncbi:sigma-70 family RNA polymerase sigma factor [Croceitalea sp. MTPC5]|uniref:RNA polymerase sigma factor n=1 Tax=Croceitalea sp. MTPC5 TaxID=3056565 RepID=UPI002B36E924|nr:sigma-70 family RNA polymerase sigma factor [Croceitalea sp. MTPC5]